MNNVELISGWHDVEQDGPVPFHRMARESRAVLTVDPPFEEDEIACLSVCAVDPGGDLGGPRLSIQADGELLGEATVGPHNWEEYAFPLTGGTAPDRIEVRLAVDRWIPPKEGIDPREFGLAVHSIRLLRAAGNPLPMSMELESTTACNINPPCVMCYPRANPDYGPCPPVRDLDDRLLDAVRPGIEKAGTLSLHGIGEPLLSKQTRKLVEGLKPDSQHIQFNTNGLMLTEEWSRLLVDRGLNRICFSIDAATPETYRRIRRNDLHRVVENIRRLQQIKSEQGRNRPHVEMNMTLMTANLNEAEGFIELAAELGARYVVFGLLNETADYVVENDGFTFRYSEQRIDEQNPEFLDGMARCRQRATELGIDLAIHTSEVPL